ncbi:MAG: peptidoglycan-binding protein, partial [Minisyncoccia bacterium]
MKKILTVVVAGILFVPLISFASFSSDLHYGSSGQDVSALQQFLSDQGYFSGSITGNFYQRTRDALSHFQRDHGISPDTGYFGPVTRAAVNNWHSHRHNNSSVTIASLNPTSGPSGTVVVVSGSGFTSANNSVFFSGITSAVADVSSSDGSTLSFTVPSTVAPASYNLSVQNSNGTSNSISFAVTAQTTTPAPTCSISASPSSITSGQSATLTWNSTNATSASITGLTSTATTSSTSVSPTTTTTYTDTVTGAGGTG